MELMIGNSSKVFAKNNSSGKSGKTDRRSIYKLLDQAIKDEIIEAENCGGIGVMLLQWDLEQS